MKFALPVVVAALFFLWMFFTRRRLRALEETADRELASFSLQQSARFESLVTLMALTEEYAPDAMLVRSDFLRSRRDMIFTAFTLEEAERKEQIMSGILTQIIQAVQRHPEMQADERYFKCMSTMSLQENLSRTRRLLYNNSVGRLNRELLFFPTSIFRYLPEFQKREYLKTSGTDPPIYTVFPPTRPCSVCAGDGVPPGGDDWCRKGFDNGGPPIVTSVHGSDNSH